jgi:transposase-like protein
MKRLRRLRRLEPDQELLRRRAGGGTLRALARDYGVAHTTLGRYFKRPDVAHELTETARRLTQERRAVAAQQAELRRLERQVREKAREQAAERRALAHLSAAAAAHQRRRPDYEAWLDEHDARRPLTRSERGTAHDELADDVVAAGGGVDAVVETTGLRTRENVLRLIDPEILVRAFTNDVAAKATAAPEPLRLRRLVPDDELIRRRATGETLRSLASDYGVAHTTLLRHFARPQIAQQLRTLARRPPKRLGARQADKGTHARNGLQLRVGKELAALIGRFRCPSHGRTVSVRFLPDPTSDTGESQLEASCCCEQAAQALYRVLSEEIQRSSGSRS